MKPQSFPRDISLATTFLLSTLFLQTCSAQQGTKPLRSGYLKVSDLHSLYYETWGNEKGIPAICLHGGPGGIAGPWMKDYFDLSRFHVVLFDQRGAGRSKPEAEWRENTTHLLMADIDRIRKRLGITGKALLLGGSWGTTLALAYAEAHPDKVAGLVLRGVYLGTKKEMDHFYHGGAAAFFPEAFDRLQKAVPKPESLDYPRQIFELTQHEDKKIREKACFDWVLYEISLASARQSEAQLQGTLRRNKQMLRPIAVLENHYLMNNCFLAQWQLMRDVGKIAHLPTFIVNGRFDAICPPVTAWQLSKKFKTVKLELPGDAGHSSSEPSIKKALKRGVEWVAKRIAK